MISVAMTSVLDTVRASAQPITGAETDYDSLLTFIGDASVVLLGEASHGTHEFYRSRAQITQRLIREKGFSAIAVEDDCPDAYRVNRFLRGGTTRTEKSFSHLAASNAPYMDVAQQGCSGVP